jgi:MerR family redox-sensitive transcriptional activator SoxR
MSGWSIGEVATRAGLRPSALRYYEQVGLLPPQLRVSGQRRYDPGVLNTLALIAYAKQVGFTIADTQRLLSGFGADVPASARWRELGSRKQRELDATIAKALRMRHSLQAALHCTCDTLTQCGHRIRSARGRARRTDSR